MKKIRRKGRTPYRAYSCRITRKKGEKLATPLHLWLTRGEFIRAENRGERYG